MQFYRGSIIRVLHDFTGRSTGVLLYGFYMVLLGVIQRFNRKVLHGFTARSTGVLLYGSYTILLGVLQGFYYRAPTKFYWEFYRSSTIYRSTHFYLAFYRGSTIEVLHGFTGDSTGVLL